MYGSKVVDLRTLYGFRLLLKRQVVNFKKVIVQSPDPVQLMQILWNAMDPGSNVIALQQKLDEQNLKISATTSTSATSSRSARSTTSRARGTTLWVSHW